MVQRITAALATLAIFSFGQVSAQEKPPATTSFATENCRTGCFHISDDINNKVLIYSGAVEKSYRICSNNQNDVKIIVDEVVTPIIGGRCADVNGKEIYLERGDVRVGRLPD